MVKEAWENITIIINSLINDLCSQGRYEEAKQWEGYRDIIALTIAMSGVERVMK